MWVGAGQGNQVYSRMRRSGGPFGREACNNYYVLLSLCYEALQLIPLIYLVATIVIHRSSWMLASFKFAIAAAILLTHSTH